MGQMVHAGFSEELPFELTLKGWNRANHDQNPRNSISERRHSKLLGPAAAESLYILCVCDVKTQREPRIHLASPWPGRVLPYDKAEQEPFGSCSGTHLYQKGPLSKGWYTPLSGGHPSVVVLWLQPQRTRLSCRTAEQKADFVSFLNPSRYQHLLRMLWDVETTFLKYV